MTRATVKQGTTPYISWARALGIWAICAVTLWTLRTQLKVNIDNLSIGLILAAALSSVYLTPFAALLTTMAASALFTSLIPPVGSLKMALLVHQELVIFTSLIVAILVGILTSRLRQLINESRERADRAHQLSNLGESIRRSGDPMIEASAMLTLLEDTLQAQGSIWCQAHPTTISSCPALVACHLDSGHMPELLTAIESQDGSPTHQFLLDGVKFLLLPIQGALHRFGWVALRLNNPKSESERKRLDEAIISLDVWAKAIEINWQSLEVRKAKEVAYQQGIHSALLSAISHEFRTPLSTILMASTSLIIQKSQLSADEMDKRLSAIGRQAKQLRSVTNHILELSRLESGKGQLRKEWESAEELIGIALRRFEANHPDLPVETKVEPSLPLFECDQVLILQLLENLLENAICHGGPQPPALHAWQSPDALCFAVRDRGSGVQEDLISTLFSPYQTRGRPAREDSAREQHQVRKGFGLGLPLSRAIAEAHGGELTLEYTSPQGSSFLFTLPLPDAGSVT